MKPLILPRYILQSAFLIMIFLFTAVTVYAAEKVSDQSLENIALEDVNSVLAKLSDEQVRNLLIAELTQNVADQDLKEKSGGRLFTGISKWLHIFDFKNEQEVENNVERLVGYAGQLPDSFAEAFIKLGDGSGAGSAAKNVGLVMVILLAAFGIELFYKALTEKYRKQFLSQGIPDLNGYMRFLAGVMREIPFFVDLVIYTAASFLLLIISPLYDIANLRYLFLAILFNILCIRIVSLLSHLICSPKLASLRLLPVNDEASRTLHRIILFTLTYLGFSLSFIALIGELGVPREAMVLTIIFLGSILLFLTAAIIVSNRKPIADYILSAETADTASNWVIRQFAFLWHIPALFYLFIVWVLFLFQQILGIKHDKEVFLLSLLVLPIFLILDRIGRWVVEMTIKTLKIYQQDGEINQEETDPEELSPEQKEKHLIVGVHRVTRLAILLALGGWVMSLWGYHLPYVTTVTQIVFRSLVTMALALVLWRIISAYIEKKILEDEPEETEEEEDSEWGGGALRGRSYTLLPMVRKFIGTVLVVMVTLTVLSTLGIEIAPLLAGAGVVGLAIGFGAQKLVSDVFSGFFFLLDDAFRVGEYLEAGGVSGAVEGITLRNVLLRHHRGMLQIVPYSELGSITNYMRGGIVVKFNLEFPYDTDVDLVRRIIKKVGKAMLEDEDFGKDFIRPVKSQGVREITNSVMVIRVKFTAQPGTHFVIRREAYRRITEALAAKGIHYAHRKVIVEVPGAVDTPADQQKIAEAGAAAGLAAMAEDDQRAGKAAGGTASGMPEM